MPPRHSPSIRDSTGMAESYCYTSELLGSIVTWSPVAYGREMRVRRVIARLSGKARGLGR